MTDQGVHKRLSRNRNYKRVGTSPANTILELELKKFHELATNVRRLRLESPRGNSVGGKQIIPRPEWDRIGIGLGLADGKDEIIQLNPGAVQSPHTWITWSRGSNYPMVGCILTDDPTGSYSMVQHAGKSGLEQAEQGSILYILRRLKQRQRKVFLLFLRLPFFGLISEYFWWDLLFRDHVFGHISREGTLCEKRSAGCMHPAVVCEVAGSTCS